MNVYRDPAQRCAICHHLIVLSSAVCSEDPLGRPCTTTFVPVPREDYKVSEAWALGAESCVLCGLPIPPKPHFFICAGHMNGGWCFDRAQAARVARQCGVSVDEVIRGAPLKASKVSK